MAQLTCANFRITFGFTTREEPGPVREVAAAAIHAGEGGRIGLGIDTL